MVRGPGAEKRGCVRTRDGPRREAGAGHGEAAGKAWGQAEPGGDLAEGTWRWGDDSRGEEAGGGEAAGGQKPQEEVWHNYRPATC